ncbi:MAG: glutathione binding-like protein, partial [Pseudomonadota bacterium]
NRPKVMDGMAWLDARLAASEWVAGTRFSIADISAVVGLDFLRVVKLGIPETCPALAAWVERVRARPSHKA